MTGGSGVRAKDIVARLAPRAKPAYERAFQQGDAALAAASITTPIRLAHFMAQVLHETGGLTLLIENGAYTARNLGDMWDAGNWRGSFADRAACVRMAEQCRVDRGVALFSRVYGGRMGNGAAATQDGWRYRGRGLFQITGRAAYAALATRYGVDFVADPDLVLSADHALKPALAKWDEARCNAAADADDIALVTKRINGGSIGLSDRKAWLAAVRGVMAGIPASAHVEQPPR
jgi:putative chitinase